MEVLYIGDNKINSTSYHRACALQRLGHNVTIINPRDTCGELNNFLLNKFHYVTGYAFLQKKIRLWLINALQSLHKIDLIWINGGEFLGIECLGLLKEKSCPILLYNNDDPTGGRDGRRFATLLRTIPYYDICVVMRDINVIEYIRLGAKKVYKINMSYDEVAHKPFEKLEEIDHKFYSDVVFIGTWMPNENRDIFLLDLIEKGVNISIWGDAWQRSSRYSKLKPYIKGKSIYGRDYVSAIQGAKITIGLLSKGNRDKHTQRSLEIPYIGGLLCAERTTDHLEMFEDRKEAVFWDNSDECATLCKQLLLDNSMRERIRLAGMKTVRNLKAGNEDICNKIMQCTFEVTNSI